MTDKTEWLDWARLDWTGVKIWTGEWLARSHSPSIVKSGHSSSFLLRLLVLMVWYDRMGGGLRSPLISTVGIGSSLTGPSSYQSPSWEEVFARPAWGLAGDWEQTPALLPPSANVLRIASNMDVR